MFYSETEETDRMGEEEIAVDDEYCSTNDQVGASTSLEGVDNVESPGIPDTRHSCVTSIEKEATPLSLPIGRKKSSRDNSQDQSSSTSSSTGEVPYFFLEVGIIFVYDLFSFAGTYVTSCCST